MTLQLVEGQEGGQLLDLNQHEFHLMTGYGTVCMFVCGGGGGGGKGREKGWGGGGGGGSNLKVHT